ncbi:MAG TPA: hypothetical protein VKV37_03530 [Ktedonobacteraceae bacterium]|nr:hypothetical protein [Ktedonobacteraceae bacterium]
MLDPMFSFVEPIVEPIEDEANLFHFIAQVEALFDHPEQFQSEYEKLKESAGLKLSEEGQKLLDMQIGLTLIGQQGRERMAERIRTIYAKYKTA